MSGMVKSWIVRAPTGTARYWITLVIVVSRLAAGPWMRAKMVALGLVMPLRDLLIGPRETHLRLRYGRLEAPWVVGPKSDFDVLNELLVLKIYAAGLPATAPRTILDLGSHMGASVLFWHERFPDARIVAVEPDPASFSRLQRNVGTLPGVELRHLAVAAHDGPARFFPAKQGWVSSLTGTGSPIAVEARTLATLLAELGHVDLLKIDIEGAEREVIECAPLEKVGAIVGEYHDSGDPAAGERFFSRLRDHFTLEVGESAAFIPFAGVAKR